MIGGVGSGKSYTIGDLLVKYRCENKANEVFIGANSHRQLRDSTIKAATDRLKMYGFKEDSWLYMEQKGFFYFEGMKCYLRSLENVDKAIHGLTVDKMIVDEYAFCGRPNQSPMYIHKKIIQRLRGSNGKNEFVALTSPNGVNFLHDLWVTNATDQHHLVKCKTKDNTYLPEGYYESLVAAYGGEDTPLAKQELFGEFINVTDDVVYYSFDKRHVQNCELQRGSIFIGMDFNVNPMTAVVCQVVDDTLYVIDEFFLKNSDTFKMCEAILKKGYKNASVIPDSTGSNRKTSGKSDFDIIRQHGFKIESTRNPYVTDRVNNINRLFKLNRIIINPRCRNLISDLEKVTWRNNKLDQQTDKMLTHISDCLGYAANKLLPFRMPNRSSITFR